MRLFSAWRWAFSRTMSGIFGAFGQFFLALSLAGFTLTIPFFLGTLAWSLSQPIVSVPLVTEITVFAQRSAGEKTVRQLAQKIESSPIIDHIRIIPKAEALASVNASLGIKTRQSKTNPLPDLIVATCKKTATRDQIRTLAGNIEKLSGVDSVAYDDTWALHVGALIKAVTIVAGILGTIVCILVLLVIAASVRLTTIAQVAEIRALYLFGAYPSFIKRPYIWRGFITLGCSALFSLGLTRLAIALLAEPVANFAALYSVTLHLALPAANWCAVYVLAAACLGAIIGNLAASAAIRKECKTT